MNAQEIVNILKENKTKGIAFYFFSEDIQDWIHDNFNNPNLLYFDSMGNWQYFKDADFDDYDNVVFALPDMFDLLPKPQTGWVEFVIYDGIFTEKFGTGEEAFTEDFHWWNWQEFLDQASNNDMGFTAFGGWQYEGFLSWYMQPMLRGKGNKKELRNYEDNHEESTPTIPVKIRFWREAD